MQHSAINFILLAVLFSSCATQPDKMSGTYVSPLIFKDYDCDQVTEEMRRLSRKIGELYGSLKETADTDSTQMGVGMLILRPTLFFLDGDGDKAVEYKRLKGEQTALEEVAIQKKCSKVLKQIREARPIGIYKKRKLKQVLSKPISNSFEVTMDILRNDLGVNVKSSRLEGKKARITGKFEDGTSLTIKMKKIGISTEFEICVGAGDEEMSRFVMSKIDENLFPSRLRGDLVRTP